MDNVLIKLQERYVNVSKKMKKMKVEEGTDILQEIYFILSGNLCEKFFYVKEGKMLV